MAKVPGCIGEEMVIAGDGRYGSMDHSAKYYAYTVICCNVPLISLTLSL